MPLIPPESVDWQIEQVTDDTALGDWHAVAGAALRHDVDDWPLEPLSEYRPLLGREVSGERHLFSVGRVSGAPVAAGVLRMPVHDNTDLANLELYVHPAARRRGHGRRMVQALLAGARTQGRTRVLAEVPEPLDAGSTPVGPGPALATSVGARRALREVRRTLELADLSAQRRMEIEHDALRYAEGYDILEWVGLSPADQLDDLAALQERMSTDPPHGSTGREPEHWDAARLRAQEEGTQERGRQRVVCAARYRASGRTVGVSTLAVNHACPEVVYQWNTVVAPEHRGHRLGILLKIRNLDHLARRSPHSRTVATWNAADNAPMVAINEALGFRPREAWTEWRLDLV